MQRAALAIAEHAREIEDARLAGRQQLLAGEFRRGVQIERPPLAVRRDQLGREGMQMRLVAGRDLQRRGLDLDEAAARANQPRNARRDPAPRASRKAGARHGRRAARTAGDFGTFTSPGRRPERLASARQDRYVAPRNRGPSAARQSRIEIVKVIASQLRKGNIVDIDGKLYVVLTAENFHPGKGTPTTQVDMRRISDGVKTSQRYKTTDQVERAHVEDHEYSYLYQDGDGFHFMNQENYDQVPVPADVVGDQAAYLQEDMKVKLAHARGHAGLDRDPAEGRCWKSSTPSRR